MILVLLLLFGWITNVSTLQVACYHCYGNSTTEGQICSIDNLCLGESCYFSVKSTGEWSASCANSTAPPTLVCSTNKTSSTCSCTADLCNQFYKANETLHKLWGSNSTFSKISLYLPSLPIYCLECGNVSVAGISLRVPCVEKHLCRGSHCITKRGSNPHSYCGSPWEGDSEVCSFFFPTIYGGRLCGSSPINHLIPASSKSRKCKNSMKFSPNAQAVFMGEKLGQAIRDGIGTDSKAAQEFADGVDTHICD
ncbi:unnamed protein product [Haemonchus placei]|uniref:Phospholipase A2 inhibitor and Ly6/PLAUR domain-containing protein-like n=1 Tax=Haemonchus placei TaxID=6290 RepID=A0A0N4X3G6_HAEPC|nr:unnamed protein product [Haemonchus placei]